VRPLSADFARLSQIGLISDPAAAAAAPWWRDHRRPGSSSAGSAAASPPGSERQSGGRFQQGLPPPASRLRRGSPWRAARVRPRPGGRWRAPSLSLRSMCLISTLVTLMPQESVCASRMVCTSRLRRSRSASISSSSCLPSNDAQGGLGELAGGHEEVLDLDDGLLRVDDAEEHDRIDLDRDVVARDHVLRGSTSMVTTRRSTAPSAGCRGSRSPAQAP
jgi:hypothetical protein